MTWRRRCGRAAAWLAAVFAAAPAALAGGGLVLKDDSCILSIGFYDAHFTAYQPQSRGDREFCESLPDTGETVFVLDYLHRSLSEVPVDLRIIRNVTGQGEFAREADVAAIADLDAATVYYQPPVVRGNGTLLAELVFAERGEYVGIVTAGHPSNDNTYTSVFPFTVGATRLPWGWIAFGGSVLLGALLLVSAKRIGGPERAA